jgi:hypothetical protein
MNIGIDYDFPSMNMVCAKLEPLVWLCHQMRWKASKIKAFVSPSGKGWHIRLTLPGPITHSQRALELIAGDDPWRHCYSIARNEAPWQTPLFEVKIKGDGKPGKEKYHRAMSKRIMEMFL